MDKTKESGVEKTYSLDDLLKLCLQDMQAKNPELGVCFFNYTIGTSPDGDAFIKLAAIPHNGKNELN